MRPAPPMRTAATPPARLTRRRGTARSSGCSTADPRRLSRASRGVSLWSHQRVVRGILAVQVRLLHAELVGLLDALAGPFAQLLDRAELDGLRWTRLRAGGDQTIFLAIVAKRAFVRMAVKVGEGDDAEGASRHAI